MHKIHPNLYPSLFCLLIATGLCLGLMTTPAEAKWFGSKKPTPEQEAVQKVQTYQPPPPEAVTRYCEPYRAEVVAINHKSFLIRPFYIPRRTWLIHEHQKCRHELMSQEYTYLKHADIEQSPSLPKISPTLPQPGGPNGNLP